MRLVAGGVERAGVGVEGLAERPSGPERVLHGEQRVAGHLVHLDLARRRPADAEGAHHAGVVVAVDAGPFQGQLIVRVQVPAPAVVAAQERARPGADDEGVAGIVAPALEHRALHGGQDVALEDAGPGQAPGLVERLVRERRGAACVDDLGLAFHQPQAADQLGGVGERAEALERRLQALAVARGQPVGLVLHAQALALAAVRREQDAQRLRRAGLRPVDPDPDVLDHRGRLGLAQVGGAGQQRHAPVGAEIEALEKDVSETVVAGQVVHALLAEQEQPVEALARHLVAGPGAAAGQFLGAEVQGHGGNLALSGPDR